MKRFLSVAAILLTVLVLVLAIPTKAAEGTVLYVSDAGIAGNSGASAGAALDSLATAISKLPAEGGTIVVCGDLTIKDTTPVFAAKTGKVTVTGAYGGTDYDPTVKLSAAANMILQFQSEIAFNNLTFDRTGDYYTEFVTGPSLTIGENVTFLDDGSAMSKGGDCITIRLGYSNAVSSLNKKCASAFFRMESGTVNYIQGGNKWNDVGAARIEMTGSATVTDHVQCGGTNHSVDEIFLSLQDGVSLPIVYAGGYGASSSQAGTVGSVTVAAGNSHIGKLYASRTDYYTITTKLNIVLNNTSVGGFNMSGGDIDAAAKVYLQFKNQSYFIVNNVLSWVDTLKVLENSTVHINADYAGPASVTVTSGSTLYLNKTLNASSDLPSNTETSGGTIALYAGQDLPLGEPITMYYDDRLDVKSYKQVIVAAAGMPTSYQVGYGIAENAVKDSVVVTYDASKKQLIATGIGTAEVVLGQQRVQVTVKAAPISLFLMIGQSNMVGFEGDPDQSIVCPDGQVYSTWAEETKLTTKTGTQFVASALSGSYKDINRAGGTDYLSDHPINSLTADGAGKKGMDGGLGYEWNKLTGEKVWLVNAAHGATSMGDWIIMDGDDANVTGKEYKQLKVIFGAVLETMKAEISAGHYTLSHYAYYWCQGCTDRVQSTDWYLDKFSALHTLLKQDFAFDFGDGKGTRTLESTNLVLVRACGEDGMNSLTVDKHKDYFTYHDLEMTGIRVAQYYMANSTEAVFRDVHMVSNIGDQWVWWDEAKTEETTSAFFKERYPNGIDYPIQVGSMPMPTSPTDVKDSIHYNQVGFNEVGREAARNTYYRIYPEKAPGEEVSIKLYGWDGVTDLAGKTDTEELTENQVVVPVVYPLYRSKELVLTGDMLHDYSQIEGTKADYAYYSIPGARKGTVTATVADVTVSYTLDPIGENKTFRWETKSGVFAPVAGSGLTKNDLTLLTGTNENGLAGASFSLAESVVLRHDQPWKVEWQGAVTNPAGSSFMVLASSCSPNTLDAPHIIMSSHSVVLSRRLDESALYVDNDGEPCARIYFDHYRGKATMDMTSATTVYGLVNEIAADGSNMIWLYINGTKTAALNSHHGLDASGVNESGVIDNWVSGKDFVFGYIGAKSPNLASATDPNAKSYDYTLTGTLKYLQVSENRLVKTEAVAATCTTDGCKAYYTDPDTGKIYADASGLQETTLEDLKIPAAHSLEAVAYNAPTTEATGNEAHYKCTVCGALYLDAAGQQPTTEEAVTIPKLEITGKLGDADGDGHTDAYDASLIKKYSVGAISASDLNLSVLDLDGDGHVDAYDASLIQKYSVGAIDKFPVEN